MVENTAYMATTYFCTETSIKDPQLTCIGDTFDSCFNYMLYVRHIPVVQEKDIHVLPTDYDTCVTITSITFASESNKDSWMTNSQHQPFILVPYGKIDKRIAGIKKKDSKNIMVPNIVADYIDGNIDSFKAELQVAEHTLKTLLYYINGFDRGKMKVDADSRTLVKALQIMENARANAGWELENDMYQRHPILFCGEAEYRAEIQRLLTLKDMDDRYHQYLYDES